MSTIYTTEELQAKIDKIEWFHNMELNGIWTGGPNDCQTEVESWDFPKDYFSGKTVLDVGAWDGFYSFHAEKQGAKAVTGLDYPKAVNELGRLEGFKLAKEVYNSEVKRVTADIMEYDADTYDVVIFAGVLYHLENPYLALQKVKNLVNPGGSLFIETHACRRLETIPIMQFYPSDSLCKDKTNFWGPNRTCLQSMITEIGGLEIDRCFYRDNFPTRLVCYCTKEK